MKMGITIIIVIPMLAMNNNEIEVKAIMYWGSPRIFLKTED